MPNLAALRAAVFPLSAKNLRGAEINPSAVRVLTLCRDFAFSRLLECFSEHVIRILHKVCLFVLSIMCLPSVGIMPAVMRYILITVTGESVISGPLFEVNFPLPFSMSLSFHSDFPLLH